jgi:hypothetical protein
MESAKWPDTGGASAKLATFINDLEDRKRCHQFKAYVSILSNRPKYYSFELLCL